MHRDGRHETGRHVNRILNPEHRHVQNQIPHRATADTGDDGEPHESHHVHPLPRGDQRSGHGEHDCRTDVEEINEPEQVRGIDQRRLHAGHERYRMKCLPQTEMRRQVTNGDLARILDGLQLAR